MEGRFRPDRLEEERDEALRESEGLPGVRLRGTSAATLEFEELAIRS